MEKDSVDSVFNREFHQWVREWIETNEKKTFDSQMGYDFYIMEVWENDEERVNMFFKLAELFLREIKEKQ